MKSTDIARPITVAWLAFPSAQIAGFLRTLRERHHHRRAFTHLRDLDDYLLADIGLQRDQLRFDRSLPVRPS